MTDRTTVMDKLSETAKINKNIMTILITIHKSTNIRQIENILNLFASTLQKPQKDFLKLLFLMTSFNDIQTYFDKDYTIFYNKEEIPDYIPAMLKGTYIVPIVEKVLSQYTWSERIRLLQILDPTFECSPPPAMVVGGKKRRTRRQRKRTKSYRKKSIKGGRRKRTRCAVQ
jgi:hypothetical protein